MDLQREYSKYKKVAVARASLIALGTAQKFYINYFFGIW